MSIGARHTVLAMGILGATAATGCHCEWGELAVEEPPPPATVEPAVAAPPRIPPFTGERMRARLGYLEGGLVHAAARPEAVVRFLQRLPLPPELAHDLAAVGAALGLDLRVDDIVQHFGIDPDGVITMTIGRPLDRALEEIRLDLTRDPSVVEALARPDEPVRLPEDFIPTRTIPAAAIPPVATALGDPTASVDGPPALPPESIAKAEQLRRKAAGLGLHTRIHVPATDPGRLPALVAGHVPRGTRTTWDRLCAAIPGPATCLGEHDLLVVFRELEGDLVIDVVAFTLEAAPDDPTRIAAVREAMLGKPATTPALENLRGDVAVFVDAASIPRVAKLQGVRAAWRSLQWSTAENRADVVRRRLKPLSSLERELSAPRLLSGLQAEFVLDPRAVAMRVAWVVAPGMEADAARLLAPPPASTPMPTLAALCDGATACARTRGLPMLSTLAERLGHGVYAEAARDFQRTWDDAEDWSLLAAAVTTWPNILGSLGRWIPQEAGDGPPGIAATRAVSAAQRIEGAGASLRDWPPSEPIPAFVVYARAPSEPIEVGRSVLGLLGHPSREIDGVQWHALEGGGVGVALDPDRGHGWIFAADRPQQLAWLAGLPTEEVERPGAYFEVPNLWALLGRHPFVATELSFARAWLSDRGLRTQLSLEEGRPTLSAIVFVPERTPEPR